MRRVVVRECVVGERMVVCLSVAVRGAGDYSRVSPWLQQGGAPATPYDFQLCNNRVLKNDGWINETN